MDQLAALDPAEEIATDYQLMIDSYRRRTALVDQALAASADGRPPLVSQLLGETATGADAARRMGLNDCILRSSLRLIARSGSPSRLEDERSDEEQEARCRRRSQCRAAVEARLDGCSRRKPIAP